MNPPNSRSWLLLIHQIPPKPDYFRVKVRRRLQQIGALALKNSVYVLPDTAESLEDFSWLRRMVVDEGGDATLCTTTFVEGFSDAQVERLFRQQSDKEFDEIIKATTASTQEATETDIKRLRRQLARVNERAFFGGDRAKAAQRAVEALQESLMTAPSASPGSRDSSRPRGATWVTREGVFVDRMASAWLIKRFIDPDARFKFVPSTGYEPAATELRFDMFEGEYTHEGDACTFEVLLTRFGLTDSALQAIAQIVHDIDCKDEKFGRQEAVGVSSVLHGIVATHADDVARLTAGGEVFEGLYRAFGSNSA